MPRPTLGSEEDEASGVDCREQMAFSELKSFFQGQLASFKDEVKKSNNDAINKAVKRMRGEQRSKHVFKSKGNEEQFENQERMEAVVDDASDALEAGNIHEAKTLLDEGKNIIATRKKHIVLADMHGWDFVSEYKDIPIADDDGDEKRIRKVLKSVESKREKRKTEKTIKANTSKFNTNARSNTLYASARPVSGMSSSAAFTTSAGCYMCGKPGHFWRNCYLYRTRSSFVVQNVGGSQVAGRQLLPLQQATFMPTGQPKPS